MSETRSKTITWEDPMTGSKAAMTMRGLDYLRAMMRGEIPGAPIAQTMDFALVEVEEGRAAFAGTPGENLYNPIGSVHGGFAATLLDSALGCAVHTTLEAGEGYSTVELHVNYVRPLTAATGKVTCSATVIHRGKRVATAEGKLVDDDGKLYAHGTTTCMILR